MKRILLSLLVLSLVVSARAESYKTLTLNDGTVLENVRVTKEEPDGLRVTHSKGAAKVKFDNLSPELQKKYFYDRTEAAQYTRQVSDSRALAEDAEYQRQADMKVRSQQLAAEEAKRQEAYEARVAAANERVASQMAMQLSEKQRTTNYTPDPPPRRTYYDYYGYGYNYGYGYYGGSYSAPVRLPSSNTPVVSPSRVSGDRCVPNTPIVPSVPVAP